MIMQRRGVRRHLCRGAEANSHGPVQETIEILPLQYIDKVIDVLVVPVQCPSAGVEKTAELPHCSRRALDKVGRLMLSPWRALTTSLRRSRRRRWWWRRMQRLALQLAFGLCGSARGSSSTIWDGQCGGVPMAIGAPSHTHGLSFTRKPQPMNNSSPRTFLTEAVVAASGPGGVAGAAGGERGSEAARCSCAEDRDDGRGRPCALQ